MELLCTVPAAPSAAVLWQLRSNVCDSRHLLPDRVVHRRCKTDPAVLAAARSVHPQMPKAAAKQVLPAHRELAAPKSDFHDLPHASTAWYCPKDWQSSRGHVRSNTSHVYWPAPARFGALDYNFSQQKYSLKPALLRSVPYGHQKPPTILEASALP